MKTILAALVLTVLGAIVTFLCVWILNIGGMPGAIFALKLDKAGKARRIFAIALTVLSQSYVYLSYVAFVVNWTARAGARDDMPLGFLLWLPALFIIIFPIYWMIGSTSERAKVRGFISPQDIAAPFTFIVAILAFIVFAFAPNLIKFGWGWVPYVR
jgi:hypothetical protein